MNHSRILSPHRRPKQSLKQSLKENQKNWKFTGRNLAQPCLGTAWNRTCCILHPLLTRTSLENTRKACLVSECDQWGSVKGANESDQQTSEGNQWTQATEHKPAFQYSFWFLILSSHFWRPDFGGPKLRKRRLSTELARLNVRPKQQPRDGQKIT